jgi:rhodanese-related sulfurtransferase
VHEGARHDVVRRWPDRAIFRGSAKVALEGDAHGGRAAIHDPNAIEGADEMIEDENPAVEERETARLSVADMVKAARAKVRETSPRDASERLRRREFDVVLDVREPGEFSERHLPGAVNVPRGLLELKADPASPVADPRLTGTPNPRVFVYCTKAPGARSLLAAETLGRMGFERVEVLEGGLNAWQEAALPIEKGAEA